VLISAGGHRCISRPLSVHWTPSTSSLIEGQKSTHKTMWPQPRPLYTTCLGTLPAYILRLILYLIGCVVVALFQLAQFI